MINFLAPVRTNIEMSKVWMRDYPKLAVASLIEFLEGHGDVTITSPLHWQVVLRGTPKERTDVSPALRKAYEALQYALEDDGLIPRATVECRKVLREAIEVLEKDEEGRWWKLRG